jgi:UDP-GlcNAc:undecaprenyl-phosphate/decaprenyl-phosphate GlcNAc-1-phosphate transferase
MAQILPGFILAFLITVLTTPLVIILARKFKLLDDPKERPHPAHIQNRVVPRAGGAPIYLGIVLSIIIFAGASVINIEIILALTLLLIIGLLDDFLTEFKPAIRLSLQFLAAIIAVGSGIGIDFITNPLGGILYLNAYSFNLSWLGQINIIADIFAVVWIVWMMNMVNWSKGVDGQMPSITLTAFLTIGILSLNFYNLGDPNQLVIAILSFICAGASLGFLIFNWYPAKIFPGFSGSTILGFMIAVLSILSGAKLATALLVLLVPTIDFFYTFFRRILEKKSPLKGDQKHLHHLLLERGFSHRQISLLYALSCAILGLLATNLNSQGKIFTIILAGVLVFGAILWLHLLRSKEEQNEV